MKSFSQRSSDLSYVTHLTIDEYVDLFVLTDQSEPYHRRADGTLLPMSPLTDEDLMEYKSEVRRHSENGVKSGHIKLGANENIVELSSAVSYLKRTKRVPLPLIRRAAEIKREERRKILEARRIEKLRTANIVPSDKRLRAISFSFAKKMRERHGGEKKLELNGTLFLLLAREIGLLRIGGEQYQMRTYRKNLKQICGDGGTSKSLGFFTFKSGRPRRGTEEEAEYRKVLEEIQTGLNISQGLNRGTK